MEQQSATHKDVSPCVLHIQPFVQRIISYKGGSDNNPKIYISENKAVDDEEEPSGSSNGSLPDISAVQLKNTPSVQVNKVFSEKQADAQRKGIQNKDELTIIKKIPSVAPYASSLDQLIDNETNVEDGRQNNHENAPHSLQDLESVENSDSTPPSQTNIAAADSQISQNELNDQGTNTQVEQVFQNERILENSYKSKLRRNIVTFAAVAIGTFFIPYLITQDTSHTTLFVILYIGLAYNFLEMFRMVFKPHIHHWQMSDDFFKACDVLCLLVFFIMLDVNLSSGFRLTKLAVIPHFAFATLAHFSISAPATVREPQTAFRIFYGVQLLLVTLKLDQDIDWSWKVTLCLVWFYCGMMIFYFIILGIILIGMLVMALYKKKMYADLDLSTQVLGHIWHFGYVGYGVIGFVVLVLTTIVLEEEYGVPALRTAVYVARYVGIFMVVYSLFFSNHVIAFLRRINSEDQVAIGELPPLEGERKVATLSVENKMVHLVKMSSTYFLPLKDSFVQKDKSSLKKLMKSVIDKRENLRKTSPEKKKTIIKETISIEDLKKDQEILEKKLQNAGRQGTGPQRKVEKNAEISLDLHNIYSQQEKNNDPSIILRNRQGICLSEGDQDFEQGEITEIDLENESNTCYVCVQNPCNAVIMNCGHGGVCYECAVEFVQKKNQCMQCRQEVDRVIKINPDPKLRNIIKGYEATKFVFE